MPKIRYEIEGDSSDLQAAADAATRKLASLKGAQDKASKSNDELTASGKKLAAGLGMGGVAGDAEDLIEGFGGLGAGAASAGIAFVALAGFSVSLAKSVADVAGRVDELEPKLEALTGHEIVSAESIASAQHAEEQVGNLSTVVDGLSAVLVDKYAPAMETAADLTVGLGVGAVDAYSAFADFSAGLSGSFLSTLKDVNAEINPFYWALKGIADAGHDANESVKEQAASLAAWEAEKKRIADADDAQKEATKKLREEMEKEAEADEKLGKSMRAERAREAAKAVRELADAEKAAQEAADADHWAKIDEAWLASAKASEAYGQALQSAEIQNSATSESMAKLQASIAAMNSSLDETPEKAKQSAEDVASAWSKVGDAVDPWAGALDKVLEVGTQIADQAQEYFSDEYERSVNREKWLKKRMKNETDAQRLITAIEIGEEEKKQERAKKRMMTAFRASQAFAIVQAIIAGAQSALAMIPGLALAMGPAAAGAPAVAAGIAGAATAVQVGVIAAQKPPKFHTGLSNGDEYTATLARGEGVANNTAMSDPGFRRELAARNAGKEPADVGSSQAIYFNDRLVMEIARWQQRVAPTPGPVGNRSHYHKG